MNQSCMQLVKCLNMAHKKTQMLGLTIDKQVYCIYMNNEPTKINNYRYSEVVQITNLLDYLSFCLNKTYHSIHKLWY